MAKFYMLSGNELIIINLFLAASAILQTLAVVSGFRRMPSKINHVQNILEVSILADLNIRIMMVSHIQYNSKNGFMSHLDYYPFRLIVSLSVIFIAILYVIFSKNCLAIFVGLDTSLLMPYVELLLKNTYPIFFIAGTLFYFFRSIYCCIHFRRQIASILSANSIKESIDMLDSGLLYYSASGKTFLINQAMNKLSACIFKKPINNGDIFWNKLERNDVCNGYKCENTDSRIIVYTPEEKVITFTKYDIKSRKGNDFLIYANDSTEIFRSLSTLSLTNEELKNNEKALTQALKNINTISEIEAVLYGKRRLHDSLSQNISLILRSIREGHPPDRDLLLSFTKDIFEAITKDDEIMPQKRLDLLLESFDKMGVNINICGKLPDPPAIANVFVDSAKECITNAVRHGFASDVFINFKITDNFHLMKVTDNGKAPSGPIKIGGGLSNINYLIENLGGHIVINDSPKFNISIYVPKEGS